MLTEYLQADNPALPAWFGRFISDNKADIFLENDDHFDEASGLMAAHATLFRNPASRFAFWREGGNALLFVDGSEYRVSVEFAEALCSQREMNLEALSALMTADEVGMLLDLYNCGNLIPVPRRS